MCIGGLEQLVGERDLQIPDLFGVAGFHDVVALESGDPGIGQAITEFCCHVIEFTSGGEHAGSIEVRRGGRMAPGELAKNVGEVRPCGAQGTGCRWDEDPVAPDGFHDRDDRHPRRAATGDDDGLAGVHPLIDGDLADGVGHALPGDREDGGGGVGGTQADLLAKLADRVVCGVDVETDSSAQERFGIKVSEYGGRVRDGRFDPPSP